MTVIVSLAVFLLVSGLIWWLVCLLPLAAPFDRVVHLVFIVMLVLIVLVGIGVVPGWRLPLIQL